MIATLSQRRANKERGGPDTGLASMDKTRIVAEVHEMVGARLFGSGPWLAEREVAEAIHKKLGDWGLQESDSENTTWATPLGKELEWDLIMVFAGVFNEFEVPMILEEHGLIEGIEVDEIYEGPDLAEHGERILRPIVQRAFLQHYNPKGRLH
jgi:hypothetical protein